MIPVHPEFPPREPSPPPRVPRRPSSRREACPEAHRPELVPRLTTRTSPPFRHATRDSAQPLHPASAQSHPRPSPAPRPHPPPDPGPRPPPVPGPRPPPVPGPRPPAPLRPSYARRLSRVVDYAWCHARHHAYLSPLTPQLDGYLSLEQFNECGALPYRFSRAPRSWKVSSQGGVAAEVSGGREDDATDGTGQGGGLCSGAPVARHRVEHAAEWVGRRL
jgi:hypothetical protein